MPFVVRLLIAWLANAAALWVADALFDGVTIDGWGPLLIAAAILSILSTILKPVLVLFSLPLILLTLGFFLLLINIAVLGLTDWIAGDGFDIEGFWTYVGTVIVVWLVNAVIGLVADRD